MNKKMVAVSGSLIVIMGAVWLLYTAGGFLITGSPAGVAIGTALAGFGIVSAWLIFNQIRFAVRADRLLRLMIEEADPRCYPQVELSPSGRVETTDAARYLTEREQAVEHCPNDWREWFLLCGAREMTRDHRGAVAALGRASVLQADTKGGSRGMDISADRGGASS